MSRSPLLVLDTNLVRFPKRDQLLALRAKGFRLTLSATVLCEVLARSYLGPASGPDKGKPDLKPFRVMMDVVAPLLDSTVPLMPTKHDHTVIVVADEPERERMLYAAVEDCRDRWAWLTKRPSDDEVLAIGSVAAGELDEDGDFSTRMNDMRGMVNGGDWREFVDRTFSTFDTDPVLTERLHALCAVMALRTAKMGTNTQGFKDRKPNDTPDLNVIAQVGLGAFVVTDDLRLIADVRESGTYQAPWIRTTPEFLAVDIEDLPRGLPWGDEAKREAERFYAALDAESDETGGEQR